MQMSASYYSTAELDRATHHEELVQGNDIEVNYTTGISFVESISD
jgi:beta-galactosidase